MSGMGDFGCPFKPHELAESGIPSWRKQSSSEQQFADVGVVFRRFQFEIPPRFESISKGNYWLRFIRKSG
jgi:hypothetical protein